MNAIRRLSCCFILAGFALVGASVAACGQTLSAAGPGAGGPEITPPAISLPSPSTNGTTTVEAALRQRRSTRQYQGQALRLAEVAQLLWSAAGVIRPDGRRPAPSAGALYPLEVSVVAGHVRDLAAGVYRYHPATHELQLIAAGDRRRDLQAAALGQDCVGEAPVVIVLTAVYERTTRKYGPRGIRYVHLEAGHAAQNICLQAVSVGLGVVPIGAFDDARVRGVLGLPHAEQPLYLLPVGKPAGP
ncbi:SagB/ThcOx family dehydrogenase [bacterium]|nr:SagB/ThcOx family dehydrogenase [bacterium]